MARIRSIKPELRTDLTVASWPRERRYAFVLLWGYCDDQGRGIDDLRLLVSDLFPLDRDITERKLNTWIQQMTDSGRVCRYETEGHRFLHIVNWHHQRINRPTPSRLPPCPIHGGPDERTSLSHSLNGSVNGSLSGSHTGSLHDSLPSRAPAEQGAGKGAGSREQGAGNARTRSSGPANDLLDQHQATLGPLPTITIEQLQPKVDRALSNGATPDQILIGLEEWRRRPGAKPGLLPHLIADAMREPTQASTSPEIEALLQAEEARRTAAGART